MGSNKKIKASDISKGMLLKKVGDDSGEFYEVGNFFPDAGWELRPRGKELLNSRGVLLYLRPERVGGYELY